MTRSLIAAIVLSALTFAACSKPPEGPVTLPPNERVRNIDLPLARRSGDALSSSATLVLIAFDAIAIGGRDLVPLTRGAMTPRQETLAAIAAVTTAVPSGTSEARIRMHTATKLATLLAVIASLRQAGVQHIGFDVRKDSLGTSTGTLVVARLDARAATPTPHAFEAPYGRTWDQIPEVWDDAFVACDGSDGSFDCSRVTERVAFGGDAEISIFRRQNGVILDMRRFGMGADVPAAEAFMNQQNDRRAGARDRDADREAAPPATYASFGFRWDSLAVEPQSPLATIMRAITASGPIGVRVSGDPGSDGGAVVTLIGSAFPDGTPAPAVMLDTQER